MKKAGRPNQGGRSPRRRIHGRFWDVVDDLTSSIPSRESATVTLIIERNGQTKTYTRKVDPIDYELYA